MKIATSARVLIVLLLGSIANAGGHFCVGNFSEQTLQWQLTDSEGSVIASADDHLTAGQGSGFVCASALDAQKYYSLSLKGANGKGCTIEKVRGDDWLSVARTKDGLECAYQSDRKNVANVTSTSSATADRCAQTDYVNTTGVVIQVRPTAASYVEHYGQDVPAGGSRKIPLCATGGPKGGWINIDINAGGRKVGLLNVTFQSMMEKMSCRFSSEVGFPVKTICDSVSSPMVISLGQK